MVCGACSCFCFGCSFFCLCSPLLARVRPLADMIIPAFAGFNLSGWELSYTSAVIARDARKAARLGRFVNSNRSSLLQPRGTFGFVVLQPLYATGSGRANASWTEDEREADWIGISLGVIPMSVVIERAMRALDITPIDLLLSDKSGPANESFLYSYHHDKNAVDTVNITGLDRDEAVATYFSYGQRDYEILCTPTVAYVDTAYSSTPLIIAIGCGVLFGIVLIMVVLACLYSSMRRAMARSAQLIQANRNKNMALDLLHEAKRISDEANRSKSDFLAFLCHELRNPLHAIGRCCHERARYRALRLSASHSARSLCPACLSPVRVAPSFCWSVCSLQWP